MEQVHIEMTDELRKRMEAAGLLGFQVEANFTYVPEICRKKDAAGKFLIPKDLWPVFTLRGLDAVESVLSQDEMTGEVVFTGAGDRKVNINSGRYRIAVCAKGIVTWRNIRNKNGEIVPPPESMSEDSLRVLSPAIISELSTAIVQQSRLTPEELLGLE